MQRLRGKSLQRLSRDLYVPRGTEQDVLLRTSAALLTLPDAVPCFLTSALLQQLPVDALWGVGPVTAKRLRERGIDRLVDVRGADPELPLRPLNRRLFRHP